MTTAPHLRGRLHDADNWAERMAQMRARTAEHVSALRAQPRAVEPAAVDPLACDADCPECGGDSCVDDHMGSVIDCPRYAARKIMAEGTNL